MAPLVTVSSVDISNDLHHAKVYVSIIGDDKQRRETLEALESAAGFIGVNAKGRTLSLYFAFVDMPRGAGYDWTVHYFAGLQDGQPKFTQDESKAAPLDLDSTREGVQPREPHDLVQQMSVEWIEPLGKWVMFYGGGIIDIPSPPLPLCGVLELFTRTECQHVDVVGSLYVDFVIVRTNIRGQVVTRAAEDINGVGWMREGRKRLGVR